MGISYYGDTEWQVMATVEARSDIGSFRSFVEHERVAFRLDPVRNAPAGLRWFNLMLDASEGARVSVAAAGALLRALNRAVDAGAIEGFRIVQGAHWLALGKKGDDDRGRKRAFGTA